MIEDIIEVGADVASSSKNGAFALFIFIIAIIGIGLVVLQTNNFEERCKQVCPTNYKIKGDNSMCLCEEKGQWVLKEFGK
ncbi:hypothetical protein N9948_01850 [bacterium]|nr:hypothetical protein [bacterium]